MSDMKPTPGQLAAHLGQTNIEKEAFDGERVFKNRYFDKKFLTLSEALDMINFLSAELLIHNVRGMDGN